MDNYQSLVDEMLMSRARQQDMGGLLKGQKCKTLYKSGAKKGKCKKFTKSTKSKKGRGILYGGCENCKCCGSALDFEDEEILGGRSINPWLCHVNDYRMKHPNLSYAEALKKAKKSYK